MECDGGEHEAENHAWRGPDHDLPTTDDVDVFEREEGEEEVRAGDDEANGRGLVEADLFEESS